MLPIKGKLPRKKVPLPTPDTMGGVREIIQLTDELKNLKEVVLDIVDEKMNSVSNTMEIIVEESTAAVNKIESLQDEALDLIREIKQGDPGKDADEEYIIDEVLSRVPKIDEEKIISEAVSRVPKIDIKQLKNDILSLVPRKSDLKIIQEHIEVDPMSVIDKIMELPDEKRKKLKMKVENIDGLSQTISAMQSQLGKGYLHGGGASILSQLNDVTITSPSNGEGLIYNSTTNKWENGPIEGGVVIETAVDIVLQDGSTTVMATEPITITLPQITSNSVKVTVSNQSTGEVTVVPYSGDSVHDDTSLIISNHNSTAQLQSTSTLGWVIV
jgi:hypothetical protein